MPVVKPITRARALDRATFQDQFELRDEPVLIEGGVRDTPGARTWSPETLAERFGNAPARFKVSSSNAHPDFRQPSLKASFAVESATFSEFLQRITQGPREQRARFLFTGNEQFLLRRRGGKTQVDEHYRELLEDVPLPELVPADRLYSVWGWFSGPGVRTWLHYDNNRCHNLNAQLTGAKECWLYPPQELAKLAPFPLGGANPAYNCCEVDVDAPDPQRFPEFERAECVYGKVEAGDLLFIPAYWIHTFRHVGEFNSNVNFWWLPELQRDNPVLRRQTLLDLIAESKVSTTTEPNATLFRELERAVFARS